MLALQEEALAKNAARLARALQLVRAARAKLASGTPLSIDDLADLTKETVMTKVDVKEMGLALKSFADRHLSADDKEAMKKRVIDRDKVVQTFNELISEGLAVMEIGDPTSPAAQDLARRWAAFNKQLGGEAPDIRAKGRAVWDDAMSDPQVAAKLALNREIFRFMNRAIDHLKAQAK